MSAVISLAILCSLVGLNLAAPGSNCSDLIVQPIEELAPEYLVGLNTTFYRKFVNGSGIPVMGSDDVAGYTLKEFARIVRGVTNDVKPEYKERIVQKKIRVSVWASNTDACSIPEIGAEPCDYHDLDGGMEYHNILILGEKPFNCDDAGNAWSGRVLLHIYANAVNYQVFDKALEKRLLQTYKNALDNKLWDNPFAMSAPGNYWPLGPTSWFQGNEVGTCGSDRSSADVLKKIDPELYDLVATIFNGPTWTDQCDEICQPTF